MLSITENLRGGTLRHRLQIQRRSATQDSFGQQSVTWSDVITVWASISPFDGGEQQGGEAVRARVLHQIVVRYQPALANPLEVAAMRGLYKGRIFNFKGALQIDERARVIAILAEEGLNNG